MTHATLVQLESNTPKARRGAAPPHRPGSKADAALLDLSMAMATLNRAQVLALTLESLARLDTRGVNWELVLVDNGSTDRTGAVAHGFSGRLPLRYVYEPRRGKSNALNRIAAELGGRLICFADDDLLYSRDWMKTMLACADDYPEFGGFGGPILPYWTRSNRQAHLQHPYACEAHAIRSLGDRVIEYPPDAWPLGPNALYRRQVLDPEPFDPDLGPVGKTRLIGNDTALAKSVAARGVRLLYVPGAVVRHIIQPQQMVPPFLWRRAYQRAKTLALAGSLAPAPGLHGVPRWMIRELTRRAACLLAAWTGLVRRPRIDAEVDLADILGWIAGARTVRSRGGTAA